MLFNKKASVSFGTIVAVFGSVLIALGVAWLLAQNWHQIPSALKIVILLSATSAAYVSGSMLRMRNYEGIGKALLVLGALLYTLSIFLIAQIFSTETTFQGIAWLLLLSWVGVVAASYIFDSSPSLVVALAEFIVWLVVQFIAFAEREYKPSFGILALCFLAAGILIYGLGLLHRSRNHQFSRTYQWWGAFYFLAFAYVLSFQSLLPSLWSNAKFSASMIAFLGFLSVSGLVAIVSGAKMSMSKGKLASRELTGMIALVALLAVLIGSTALVSNKVGYCYEKNCYDFRTKDSCGQSPSDMKCVWSSNTWGGNCEARDCYLYQNQSGCESASDDLNCEWNLNYCERVACYSYRNETECKSAPAGLNCEWKSNAGGPSIADPSRRVLKPEPVGNCIEKNCYQYNSQQSCESSVEPKCKWQNGYCDIYSKCQEYNNNYDACSQQERCQWRSGYYFYEGVDKVPLSLWAVWIFANIVFIIIILGMIGYGTWQKLPRIINLGIVAFALDIITRYIGFIMDFWGYTSLSVIFITGGIVLLLGGWLVERWRRNLIKKIK